MTAAKPRALLSSLDNTAYAYAPCHRAALTAAGRTGAWINPDWNDEARFESDYLKARAAVKSRLGAQAASRSRLLYFKEMLERRFGHSRLGASRAMQRAYWQSYFLAMRPDGGCAETLAMVRELGLRTAWVTSFTTERQMLKLEYLGLESAADLLLTSEEAGIEKPDGRLVDLALERLKTAPEAAWMVGDDLRLDLPMAGSRGLTFVWYRRDDAEEPAGDGPAHTVTSWMELAELVATARGG